MVFKKFIFTAEGCLLDQFKCRNGQCIEAIGRCNDQFDCGDFSDEEEC